MKLIKKQKSHAFGKDVYLLGIDKHGDKLWLEAPKWDCDWYWGFGYIETYLGKRKPENAVDISSHSHWNGSIAGFSVKPGKYVHHMNMNPDITASVLSDSESWILADLMRSFYTLKKAAAFFMRGSSHLSRPGNAESLKDKALEDKINQDVLPLIFKEVLNILSPEGTL